MSSDIGDWYRSIPQITRCWFTGSIVLPLVGKIGIVNVFHMILNFDLIFYHFQIWRPVTAALYYPITPQTGFHYLINLYFLYSYSSRLESGHFDGRPADMTFMLLFNWLCLVIIGFIGELPLLMDPLIISVLYVWCQMNKDQIVQFWFGTQFKAMYLPWVLVGFNMVIKGFSMSQILGILVGHLYFFLSFKYPQDFGGREFLRTPDILYKYLPNRRGGVAGFGMAPSNRRQPGDERPAAPAFRAHQWGGGNRLGDG